jgi:hypothetical protein
MKLLLMQQGGVYLLNGQYVTVGKKVTGTAIAQIVFIIYLVKLIFAL